MPHPGLLTQTRKLRLTRRSAPTGVPTFASGAGYRVHELRPLDAALVFLRAKHLLQIFTVVVPHAAARGRWARLKASPNVL